MKMCPFCAEEIQDAAIVCKHCRRDLAAVQTIVKPRARSCSFCGASIPEGAASCSACQGRLHGSASVVTRAWSPGIAGVLSFFIPGLGQIYKAEVGRGFAFLIGTIVGYVALIVPGLVVHVWAIVDGVQHEP